MAVSYSDGEGEAAGVGVALSLPSGHSRAGYLRVPDALRRTWTEQRNLVDARDIFQIEAVGPLLVLSNIVIIYGFTLSIMRVRLLRSLKAVRVS